MLMSLNHYADMQKLAFTDVYAVIVARHKKPSVEVIDLALVAKLGNLSAVVCTQDRLVTDFKIAGLFHVSSLFFVEFYLFRLH